MILYSRVTDKPTAYPVTLDEVKIHLRVDGTAEDTLIEDQIKVATRMAENYTGLSLSTQTRTVKMDRFNGDIKLPYGPVQSVTSVVYLDDEDAEQTVAAEDYIVDQQSGLSKIRVNESWPYTNRSLNNVVVTYVAGYDLEDVPVEAKEGIKKLVSRLYQKRGDDDGSALLTPEIMDTLDPIKVYWDAEY